MKKEYRKALIKAAVIGCVVFLVIIFLDIAVLNILHINDCQIKTTEVTEVTQPTTAQLKFTPVWSDNLKLVSMKERLLIQFLVFQVFNTLYN